MSAWVIVLQKVYFAVGVLVVPDIGAGGLDELEDSFGECRFEEFVVILGLADEIFELFLLLDGLLLPLELLDAESLGGLLGLLEGCGTF